MSSSALTCMIKRMTHNPPMTPTSTQEKILQTVSASLASEAALSPLDPVE